MIADAEVIAELRTLDDWRYVSRPKPSPYDYRILDVRALPGIADFELRERDGLVARIQVALPSRDMSVPWLYSMPANAVEWTSQLLIWLDEEVFTLGLGVSRARVERDGESYVIVEGYGWRVSDPREHARRMASGGG